MLDFRKVGISKSKWDSLCHRCGQCCKLSDGSDCPHLSFKKIKDNPVKIGSCDLYPHHLGTLLEQGMVCTGIWNKRAVPVGCAYAKFFPGVPT